MKRFSSFILLLFLATHAWAETHDLEFAGSTYRPESYQINGRTYYNTDDQEILQLIDQSNISAQWSSSGHTLFAFAPGRESYWTVDENSIKVNKQEMTAPGRLILKDGVRYIEPEALFFALAAKGIRTQEGYQLFPVITEVTRAELGYLLRSSAKARPKVLQSGETTVLSLDGFAWEGESDSFEIDEILFQFNGGPEQGEPLQLTISPPPFSTAKLNGATLLNETKIAIFPNFPGAEDSSEVTLDSLTAQDSEGQALLVMDFSQGAKAHYIKDERTGDLSIYVPKASYEGRALRSRDWPGLEVTSFQTPLYPVLEIKIPADNSSYEFVQLENGPTTLALLKDSSSELAATGSVQTPGWSAVARGTIVIDPGHGGSDSGCRNRHLGTKEADVTLKISKHRASILRKQGWKVVLTRTTDRDVTYAGSPDRHELEARSGLANKIGADLFMSIHCNASVNTSATGSSIHWWKAEDHAFAQALEPVLGNAIGLGQKGLIRNRFVVLRHARMPSVLVETAFLTNAREGAKLSDSKFQKVIARQLAGGLANYARGVYASRKQRPVE